ncbi:MAG: PKD domain-containing protein [Planctomycetota bacterium]
MEGHKSRAGDCSLARDVILRRRAAELSDQEGDFLVAHLGSCAECRRFEASLAGVFESLDVLARVKSSPRPEVRAAVLKNVRRLRSGRRSSARVRPASRRVGSSRMSTRKSGGASGRRRVRTGWVRVFAAAAVAAAMLVACLTVPGMLRRTGGPVPAAERTYIGYVRGEGGAELERAGRRIVPKAGDPVLAGDRFRTGSGVQLAIFFRDRSVAVVNGEGSMQILSTGGDKRLVLDRGDMFVNVERRPGQRFTVNPGRPDQVTVVGTEFELSRSEAGTVLRVSEGEVSFGLGSRAVQVTARLSSSVLAGGRPTEPVAVKPEEIAAWRTNTAPTATGGRLSTEANAPLQLVLEAEDAERDRLRFEVVSGPKHGALSGEPPRLIYVPARGFSGEDAVEFRAFDGRARSEPAVIAIYVRPLPAEPEPSLMAAASGDRAPVTVTLDASASKVAAPPATFLWDFGDGETASGPKAEHVFEKAGSYTVELTVTDRLGRSAKRTTVIKVLEEWERRDSGSTGRPGDTGGIGDTGKTGSTAAGKAAKPEKPGKPDETGKEPPGLVGKPEQVPPGQADKPEKSGKPGKKPSSKPAKRPRKSKPVKD